MNLDLAMKEITKDPVPYTDSAGKPTPALRYTQRLQSAVNWLKDRYEDGTLNVGDYDPQENVRQKKLETHSRRRGHVVDEKTYMRLKDVVDATGLGYRAVRGIAKESGSYIPVNGALTLIDKERFFGYLDTQRMTEIGRQRKCYKDGEGGEDT